MYHTTTGTCRLARDLFNLSGPIHNVKKIVKTQAAIPFSPSNAFSIKNQHYEFALTDEYAKCIILIACF